MNSPLKPGSYMKTGSVLQYLANHPYYIAATKNMPMHTGEYDIYFSTKDLKQSLPKFLFNDMECTCVTHIIFSNTELKRYYQDYDHSYQLTKPYKQKTTLS